MYNLSEVKLVEEHWEISAYFQYLWGREHQKCGQRCAASDLVHFRQRIGEAGVEKIFRHSIDRHGRDGQDPDVSVDSTVQEKNITFPTDAKLFNKLSMAKADGTYMKELTKIENHNLLIIDDFGLQAINNEKQLILMNLIEDRDQRKYTIFCSQLPVKNWYDLIEEKTITDTILD